MILLKLIYFNINNFNERFYPEIFRELNIYYTNILNNDNVIEQYYLFLDNFLPKITDINLKKSYRCLFDGLLLYVLLVKFNKKYINFLYNDDYKLMKQKELNNFLKFLCKYLHKNVCDEMKSSNIIFEKIFNITINTSKSFSSFFNLFSKCIKGGNNLNKEIEDIIKSAEKKITYKELSLEEIKNNYITKKYNSFQIKTKENSPEIIKKYKTI